RIVRRAIGKIDLITEADYKYLNKNSIEDIYLLCIDDKVKDYRKTSCQQKVNLTTPTITFFGIKEYELFNIISELVCGMIYEKNKKEKRVMVHKEIHKFDDATLKKVLEGFEKYNKDVKYGYTDLSPSKHHAKLLRYYEEDIIECRKHRDQMRRWEMYVNERPLGSRRDCPV
nr:hypothetical protein [Tanacetum cinerariifolium]